LKDLVTKDDLLATRNDLKHEIDDVRKDFKHEMKEMEQRLNARIDASDARNRSEQLLLRWIVGATFTGVIAALGLPGRLLFLTQR
jgi:Flp pilus assembly protein TadB